ncbi:MAG: hypothetical protein U0Y10_19990 [Spirosomataceae bacterium]
MKIKNQLFIFILLCCSTGVFAQYAADAFRYSQTNVSGTARFQALGGNHSALGADLSSAAGNPAGIGMYSRSELNITPGASIIGTKTQYISTTTNENKAVPVFSNFGVVFAGDRRSNPVYGNWHGGALAVTYSRQNSFQNRFGYFGLNNRSSMADSFVEQANARGANATTLDQEYNPNTNSSQSPESMYYQMYLINPDSKTDGAPYSRFDKQSPTEQTGLFTSTGAVSQWNFAYGGNYDDKLYLGVALGIARFRYEYKASQTDRYVGGKIFNSFTFGDDLSVQGKGINFSLGMIYKPVQNIRIGASLTTPTWYDVAETYNSSISVNLVGIPSTDNNGKPILIKELSPVSTDPNDFDYQITTPLKASGGIALFFGNGKKGFISADAEYVAYDNIRVKTTTLTSSGNANFEQSNRKDIQNTYKSVVNFKLGSEFRQGPMYYRGGVAYFADPYKVNVDNIDRTRLVYSAGLGYRNEGFYVDLTGAYGQFNTAYTPYTLSNTTDYASAKITNTTVNITASFGVFF